MNWFLLDAEIINVKDPHKEETHIQMFIYSETVYFGIWSQSFCLAKDLIWHFRNEWKSCL